MPVAMLEIAEILSAQGYRVALVRASGRRVWTLKAGKPTNQTARRA